MVTNNPVPAKGGSLIGATTINWEDVYKGPNVIWRVPRNIRWGDNVVVRQDESAVFYRDGKVLAYLDKPDRYSLTTLNAGILGNLVQSLSGVRQEAEVYYVQRRIFDGKFGSQEPYVFRDPDFGLVNLRVFGSYRWRVGAPDNFINQFVGTFGAVTTPDVENRLREQMVILVYNTLGKMKDQGMRVTDLASSLTTIEQAVLGAAPQHFSQFGIEMNQLQGLSVNLLTRSRRRSTPAPRWAFSVSTTCSTRPDRPSPPRPRTPREAPARWPGRALVSAPGSAWATAWPVRCRGCTSRVRPPRAPSAVRSSPPERGSVPAAVRRWAPRPRRRPGLPVRSAANLCPRGSSSVPTAGPRPLRRPHGSARSAARTSRGPGSSVRTAAPQCRARPDRPPE